MANPFDCTNPLNPFAQLYANLQLKSDDKKADDDNSCTMTPAVTQVTGPAASIAAPLLTLFNDKFATPTEQLMASIANSPTYSATEKTMLDLAQKAGVQLSPLEQAAIRNIRA
jgi:hypothetical protein